MVFLATKWYFSQDKFILVLVIVITSHCFSYSISIVYYNTINLVLVLVHQIELYFWYKIRHSTSTHSRLLLFCLRNTSRSKFKSVSRFRFPVVASPAVEKHALLGPRKLDTKTNEKTFSYGLVCSENGQLLIP